MGQYVITIEGTGFHHNRCNDDADYLAMELVQKLQEAGHTIHNASFTAGARTDIKPLVLDAGVPADC